MFILNSTSYEQNVKGKSETLYPPVAPEVERHTSAGVDKQLRDGLKRPFTSLREFHPAAVASMENNERRPATVVHPAFETRKPTLSQLSRP